ncbi:MAG TPA: methyltransferase domain-containing protein [Fimbriimonadaceae bacterium]|nr:methyltransferase domain-containing protein [Fimbriimonadaceae bacterium]
MRLLRYLDPRPNQEALRQPIAEAVNIPLAELEARTHELPPRNCAVQVVSEIAPEAVRFLHQLGRKAEAVVGPPGQTEPGRLWMPNGFLEGIAEALLASHPSSKLPPRMLDVACGSGRDCVFMAGRGWNTLGLDVLPDAIVKAQDLALRYLPSDQTGQVSWAAGDVERPEYAPQGSPYDLITMFFFLDRDLLKKTLDWLSPGGSLVVETFTTEHHRVYGTPREHRCLKPHELPQMLPELDVIVYEEALHGGRHTARFWGRKPG